MARLVLYMLQKQVAFITFSTSPGGGGASELYWAPLVVEAFLQGLGFRSQMKDHLPNRNRIVTVLLLYFLQEGLEYSGSIYITAFAKEVPNPGVIEINAAAPDSV